METNQLRSFMEVVKTGNFSEAAENLYTTQSSVSKHIQALEKDIGVKLFDLQQTEGLPYNCRSTCR